MNDIIQRKYFDKKTNRYSENLLIKPPKHVSDETNTIINELAKQNVHTVIELGSGNGRLTIPLLKRGLTVYAVDISKASLQRLRIIAQKLNCSRKLKISTHLPKRKVDAVVGTDVLHHVDLYKKIKEIFMVLKKKGFIMFSEPNILNPSWIIFISLFLNWTAEKGIAHCNYFTLKKVIMSSSFKKLRITGYGVFPLPLLGWSTLLTKVNNFLGNLPFLKLFAYRYIISASK